MSGYRTRDGDMVDRIAWAELGTEDRAPAIFAANVGVLRGRGPVLPAGLVLTLPPPPPVETPAPLRLWGRG